MNFLKVSGLNITEDSYGNNMLDSYRTGIPGYDIVERDDGCFTLNGDSDAYTEEYEKWDDIQKSVEKRITAGRVLDIGCGGGKHALHFQNKGLDTWGLDNSPKALELCKERGIKNLIMSHIYDFNSSVLNEVNTVLMLGNNLGLLQNYELAKKFFKEAESFCSDNSTIYAETLDPHGKAFVSDIDKAYIQNNKAQHRPPGQIRCRIRYLKYTTPWADYLFVSPDELKFILEGTSWFIKNIYSNPDIDQYIAEIARKPS